MKTEHLSIFSDSRQMDALSDKSVDLMVTSPPYPMIEMWDDLFCRQSAAVKKNLKCQDGPAAFESMHVILDAVWKEVYRVLKPGGFACINIGDATRTINKQFALYTNHARILDFSQKLGFSSLPCILWRKQTNAPNKFMGSGMLPAGAYVTLEHEYILILRKGGKREFTKETDKQNRRQSALFWEERNVWFSDIWFDIKGTPQALKDKDTRKRSAAYPFEIAYRLINMYSVKGDMVLDPFLGTGTTQTAAMAAGRNSIGYELETSLQDAISRAGSQAVTTAQDIIHQRLVNHLAFIQHRMSSKGPLKHKNIHYDFPVMTTQEKELFINDPINVKPIDTNKHVVEYAMTAQQEFCKNRPEFFTHEKKNPVENLKKNTDNQLSLFDI